MKFVALFVTAVLSLVVVAPRAADEEGTIIRDANPNQTIPIVITGFSGEVAAVVRFDLEVLGCKIVNANDAKFEVTGSNNGQVSGRVIDKFSGVARLEKAYSGGTTRAQAHAFCDDVVKLFGRQGIARTKVAFKSESAPGKSEIYVADYDGFNTKAVTRDGNIVAAPAWVPNKWMLLYTSYKSGHPDIFSHDLSSGARDAVAQYSGLNTSPSVSADGRRVAMILSKSGSPDLYVSNLDGSGLVQLTKTREDESSPCWSPDGRTICFVSRERGSPSLYTISASGGSMKRIPTNVGSVTEPDWSPDGKQIVFTAMHRSGFSLYLLTVADGKVEPLVAGEDPSWAPNSRTVMYVRRVGGKRVLSLLDVPTKQTKDAKLNLGSASQPAWAR